MTQDPEKAPETAQPSAITHPTAILEVNRLSINYHGVPALQNVTVPIYHHGITGFIGPSGCGKTSLLRCFNRISDLIPGIQVTGNINLAGCPISHIPEVALRRRVGMVFQRPNPFPKSIYENIALGLRINGYTKAIDAQVEWALQQVGLWHEVKDQLRRSALALSGGQQQRLCIARAIALGSNILLMDEPCSALDPLSTNRINHLLNQMKQHYTIIIVSHDLRQIATVADWVAFFNLDTSSGNGVGRLHEFGAVPDIFVTPKHQATREYVYHQALKPLGLSMVP
ncbi:MAG: phosphate ABC transporter ATP-binding protein [Cyanobacteria bacterium P01_A01_bin.123]